MTGGVAASLPTPPQTTAPHAVIQRYRRDSSAAHGSARTAIGAAARAADAAVATPATASAEQWYPGQKHRIGGVTDSASYTLSRCATTGNQ